MLKRVPVGSGKAGRGGVKLHKNSDNNGATSQTSIGCIVLCCRKNNCPQSAIGGAWGGYEGVNKP